MNSSGSCNEDSWKEEQPADVMVQQKIYIFLTEGGVQLDLYGAVVNSQRFQVAPKFALHSFAFPIPLELRKAKISQKRKKTGHGNTWKRVSCSREVVFFCHGDTFRPMRFYENWGLCAPHHSMETPANRICTVVSQFMKH